MSKTENGVLSFWENFIFEFDGGSVKEKRKLRVQKDL